MGECGVCVSAVCGSGVVGEVWGAAHRSLVVVEALGSLEHSRVDLIVVEAIVCPIPGRAAEGTLQS